MNFKNIFIKIKDFVTDALFPKDIKCIFCNRDTPSGYICNDWEWDNYVGNKADSLQYMSSSQLKFWLGQKPDPLPSTRTLPNALQTEVRGLGWIFRPTSSHEPTAFSVVIWPFQWGICCILNPSPTLLHLPMPSPQYMSLLSTKFSSLFYMIARS